MARQRSHAMLGFTLVELIVVMMVVGAGAAVVMPNVSRWLGTRQDAYRDSLVAGLRLAGVTAQHHRRLVCASLDASGHLRLRIAATNPAGACTHDFAGPDGAAIWATAPSGTSLSASPAATLYFQPAGGVAATASGAVTDFTLSPSGVAPVTVRGRNGSVQ